MPIIKRDRVRLSETRAGCAGSPPASGPGKTARLVEQAGTPCAIEVVCSCGEVTLVELVFDPPERPPGERPAEDSKR
jgi:hypothetical protein